ncbi:MAG: hypothetical protein U5L03_15940 [Burkholderiaceae bacterium]|nr:hypothetical protein [Burkholderiaceae bacterium]
MVVEGVETEEQFALLARHGAHGIQGYLVSRPVPALQFEQFMHDHFPGRFAQDADLRLIRTPEAAE